MQFIHVKDKLQKELFIKLHPEFSNFVTTQSDTGNILVKIDSSDDKSNIDEDGVLTVPYSTFKKYIASELSNFIKSNPKDFKETSTNLLKYLNEIRGNL